MRAKWTYLLFDLLVLEMYTSINPNITIKGKNISKLLFSKMWAFLRVT
jgi:hypothetical protein